MVGTTLGSLNETLDFEIRCKREFSSLLLIFYSTFRVLRHSCLNKPNAKSFHWGVGDLLAQEQLRRSTFNN